MLRTIVFFISFFLMGSLYAQVKPVPALILQEKDNGTEFPEFGLFHQTPESIKGNKIIGRALKQGSLVEIKDQLLSEVRNDAPATFSLPVPCLEYPGIVLELFQKDILSPTYRLTTSDGRKLGGDRGIHYRGMIKGNPNSLAAISIYENEITGFFSDESGNYVIGKLESKTDNRHIVYNDASLTTKNPNGCNMEDDGIIYKRNLGTPQDFANRTTGDCTMIFIEVDDDIHANKGVNTEGYVTGFFNQSAVLYANESVDIAISEIYVWTTTSPYTNTSSSGLLSQFQAQYSNTNPFNGSLGHLISYDGNGGIAAGFSGLCNPNIDNSMCFSGISSSYNTVPTFSWTVQVFTHEMGHLFGCRHTHACVWNGNGTAIDGCSSVEGSCSTPGIPSNGGTIMSYCHTQSVGINFNNGFGPQPGDVVRNNVANAGCLPANCDGSGVPACDDGIQNGYETGVDCGGINCSPCPCNDNQLQITIQPDNYPDEVSWDIKDSNGNVIASDGPYNMVAPLTTITVYACVVNGCYDFTIYDSYSDGLFDGTNTGTYSVADGNGNVLASGSGNYGASETTNICPNGAAPPTCTDGLQNGDETGVDCGGSNCPACPPTCTDGIQNQDETGIDCGGSSCPACPSCSDGIQNQDETGVDCGGATCPTCPSAPCQSFNNSAIYGWDAGLPTACGQANAVNTTYQAWTNEGFIAQGLATNQDYNLNFCAGYDPTVWEGSITIYSMINDGTGWQIQEFIGFADGCSLDFTTTAYDDYLFYINGTADACDAASTQTDNGLYELYCIDAPACVPPSNVAVNLGTDPNRVNITWDPVAGASEYQIRYRRVLTTTWSNLTTTSTSRTIQVLVQNKVYDYRVRTKCPDGTWSDMTAIDKFRTVPCDEPTGMFSTQLSNNKVRVEWANYSYADKYQIWYRLAGSSDTWSSLVTYQAGMVARVIPNLTPGAQYEWKVRSYCEVSYGPWTDLQYFTNGASSREGGFDNFSLQNPYPNPAKDILNVPFSLGGKGDIQITITDILGRTIYQHSATYGEGLNMETIDINRFDNGYYMLQLTDGENIALKKFIKR